MKLYRYSSNHYDSDNIILMHRTDDSQGLVFLHEYESVKETPCGVWICPNLYFPEKKKFINLTCEKQYASKTKEEAKIQFLYRKAAQLRILSKQILEVKASLISIELPGESYKNCILFQN